MDIQVFDDIIPQYLQDFYEFSIMGRTKDDEMYAFVPLVCRYEETANEGDYSPLSFVHVLKSSTAISPYLDNFGLIAQIACVHANKFLSEIVVGRIFLSVPYETKRSYNEPHVDLPYKHTVVLYYVNDADGDTVFFDKDNRVVRSVSPKKGRVILFDGALYHGGGIPKNGPRCIVNFDIITKELKNENIS